MKCLKVLGTALALTFTMSVAPAQSTGTTDFAAPNKITLDAPFTALSDSHFLRFDNPNFINGVSETPSPNSLLGSFNGKNPSASWTLLLSDVDFGQQPTLVKWGLEVSVVPEPAPFGFIGMGALVFGAALYRRK